MTRTDSNTLPDAELLLSVNNAKNELAPQIAKKNEQLFIIPATFDLAASTVATREYPLPSTMMNQLATVELALESDATEFIVCRPYPGGLQRLIRNINGLTEDNIRGNFTNQGPYYIKMRNGIFILTGEITSTIASVLNARGKIRYRKFPADLANLTGNTDLSIDPSNITFGMPLVCHEIWARRVSIVFKSSRPKPIPLSALEQVYESDLNKALDTISIDDLGDEIRGFLPAEDSPSRLGNEV
jgi:hypothetical protein